MAEQLSSSALGALVLGPSLPLPSFIPAAASSRAFHAPSTAAGAHGCRRQALGSRAGDSRAPIASRPPSHSGGEAGALLHGELLTRRGPPSSAGMGAHPVLTGHSLLPPVSRMHRGQQLAERPVRPVHVQSQAHAQAGPLPGDGSAAEVDREARRRLMHSSAAAPEPAPAGSPGLGTVGGEQEGGEGAWGKHLFPQGQNLHPAAVHPLVAVLEHFPNALLQQQRAVTQAAARAAYAQSQSQGTAEAVQYLLDTQALRGVARELVNLLHPTPVAEPSGPGPGSGWSVLARAAQMQFGSDTGAREVALQALHGQADIHLPAQDASTSRVTEGSWTGQAQEAPMSGPGQPGLHPQDGKGGAHGAWGQHGYHRAGENSAPASTPGLVLPGGVVRHCPRGQGRALGNVAGAAALAEEEVQGLSALDAFEEAPAKDLSGVEAAAAAVAAGARAQLREASSPPLRDGSGGARAVAGLAEEHLAAGLAEQEVAAQLAEEHVAARLAEVQRELTVRRRRATFSAAQEQRQLAMEQLVHQDAHEEHWDAAVGLMEVGRGAEMGVGRELMSHWWERLVSELERSRKEAEEDSSSRDHVAAVLLQGLPTSVLASVTLQKTVEALLMEQGRMLRQDEGPGRKRARLQSRSIHGKDTFSLNIVTVLHLGKAMEREVPSSFPPCAGPPLLPWLACTTLVQARGKEAGIHWRSWLPRMPALLELWSALLSPLAHPPAVVAYGLPPTPPGSRPLQSCAPPRPAHLPHGSPLLRLLACDPAPFPTSAFFSVFPLMGACSGPGAGWVPPLSGWHGRAGCVQGPQEGGADQPEAEARLAAEKGQNRRGGRRGPRERGGAEDAHRSHGPECPALGTQAAGAGEMQLPLADPEHSTRC